MNTIIIRLLDLFICFVAVMILAPLLLVVAVLLKLTGEGEILYKQKRVGLEGKEFSVLKFATMLKESPNLTGGGITVPNDPRVLPVGKLLRKTKINELPQLFNILKGDMSIVGPRPLMKKQNEFYSSRAKKLISKVRPGLTGMGSVFFRDEERYFLGSSNPDKIYKTLISPLKEYLEIWYIENKSISLYLRIVWATFVAIILNKNQVFDIIDDKTKELIIGLQRRNRR